MTVADLLDRCIRIGACSEARTWLSTLDQTAPAETAWKSCGCGEWMLWLAERAQCPRRLLVLSDTEIVETLIPMASNDLRPILVECVAAYRAWCDDLTPETERRAENAARAAWDAWDAWDARDARAAWAAWDARDAWAAWAARYAWAASAARAARYDWAARDRRNALGDFDAIDREHADIVRSVISWSDLEVPL